QAHAFRLVDRLAGREATVAIAAAMVAAAIPVAIAIVVAATIVEVEADARPLVAEAEINAAALRQRCGWHSRDPGEGDGGRKGYGLDEIDHGASPGCGLAALSCAHLITR